MSKIDISNAGDRIDPMSDATGVIAEGNPAINNSGAVAAPSPSTSLEAPESSTAALEAQVVGFRETENELVKYREIFATLDQAKMAAATASAEFAEKYPDKNLQAEIKNSAGVGMGIFEEVSKLPIHLLASSPALMGFATEYSQRVAENPSLAKSSIKRKLRDEYSARQKEQFLPTFKSMLRILTQDSSWAEAQEIREFVAVTLANDEPSTPAAGSPYYPEYSGGMTLTEKLMKDGEFTSTITLMAKFGDCQKRYVAKGEGRVAVFQMNPLRPETETNLGF